MKAPTICLVALLLVAGCGKQGKTSADPVKAGMGADAIATVPEDATEPATSQLDQDFLDLAAFHRSVHELATIQEDILLYLWQSGQDSVWTPPHQPLLGSIQQIRSEQAALNKRAVSPLRDTLRRRFVASLDTLASSYAMLEKSGPRDSSVVARFSAAGKSIQSVFTHMVAAFPVDKLIGTDEAKFETVRAAIGSEPSPTFRAADALLAAADTVRAYDAFATLAGQSAGQPLEHRCLVRMADCILRNPVDPKMQAAGHTVDKDAVPALVRVLDSKRYSPVLVEAWRKWRVAEQFLHGGSKLSDIPNREYDAKRRLVMMTIRHHLRDQPDDTWARYQYLVLTQQDIVRREGEFPAGNQIVLEWASLYTP